MRHADVEDGVRPGKTAAENSELKEARHKIRLLKQVSEVPRRAASYPSGEPETGPVPEMTYPLVQDLAADRVPAGDLKVARLLPTGVLRLAGEPGQ